ncbi:MarR family winged helix-turn-helix transcriptional regulator [Sinanaerobacter chloroacetimidivorans]|uniref:MarR family winged helix-turn-helix transcriptional regulator n=1 Tax=Sinanaerobacter chloroacetimidivorans TaxID=2818044 RepID=UPI001D04EC9F|nr:MarR family transcriptional regulator [Sinanaerobacter chloroacetimidivorans]
MTFDLSKCIGFVTDKATKTISEDFNRRLEKQGSTRIQWIALYFLANSDQLMSQKELAVLMNVQDSSLARLVDRMERDGLIKRVENPKDRRIKFLELTEAGYHKMEELMPEGQYFSDLLLENITEEELSTFQNVIHKMLNNIKR